jgi:hypothetical protein
LLYLEIKGAKMQMQQRAGCGVSPAYGLIPRHEEIWQGDIELENNAIYARTGIIGGIGLLFCFCVGYALAIQLLVGLAILLIAYIFGILATLITYLMYILLLILLIQLH